MCSQVESRLATSLLVNPSLVNQMRRASTPHGAAAPRNQSLEKIALLFFKSYFRAGTSCSIVALKNPIIDTEKSQAIYEVYLWDTTPSFCTSHPVEGLFVTS